MFEIMHDVSKVPITVLSAISEGAKVSKGRIKQIASEEFTDSAKLDSRYGAQANLVGFFYLLDVLIGRALYWLQLLFHL